MRSFVLRIIVIERFFVGGFPLEEASEHYSPFNKGIILVCYSLYYVVLLVIFVIFLFLLNIA
jgi:hypothetical protein